MQCDPQNDIAGSCAEGDADSQLAATFDNAIAEYAVQSDGRQDEGYGGEPFHGLAPQPAPS